jgi:hypothetical protein
MRRVLLLLFFRSPFNIRSQTGHADELLTVVRDKVFERENG